MKCVCSAESKNGTTTIMFFFENNRLIADATYFDNDLPKSKVSTELSNDKIIELYGAVESVLNGLENSVAVPIEIDKKRYVLLFQVNDAKTTEKRKMFNFRLEDFSRGSFVQLTNSGACFSALRLYLEAVVNRFL